MRPGAWQQTHLLAGCVLDFGLLQAWWMPLFAAINAAAWTLSVEAFFYAVFPLLLPLLRMMRPKVFGLLQAAYLLFVWVPAALSFTRFAQQGLHLAWLIEGPFPLFRLNTFAVGVFVGTRFLAQHRENTAVQRRSTQSNVRLSAAVLSSVGLLCLAPSAALLPLRTLLLTYAFVWVIFELADVAWPVLTNHWMQVAGEISYGIYILQFPVGLAVDAMWRRWISPTTQPVPLHILAILAAAYVSFRWFETPARLTIRRVLTGRPVPVRAV
jgi:peptidoglycan/LPS O-acetylase OafA/YrhL